MAALAATATVSLTGGTAGATVLAATGAARTTDPFSTATIERQATRALEQAQALFGDGPSTAERRSATRSVGRREPTLVLRDLARLAGDLPTATQRATAARILARPDDHLPRDPDPDVVDPKYRHSSPVGSDCSEHFCVHWVEDGSPNAVSGDGDVTTVPAWVRTTSDTMEHVYGVEVGRLGYRAPLSDGSIGRPGDPADHVDVYLADLGRKGIYGYCTSDEPDADPPTRQVYGYCVLDNDYAHTQFPVHTKLQNLQVTAAHEFFHLVQFGYDWWEDPWLMEGTAAWMEDEVYDGVNDNRQYLAESPLANPYVPLDYTGDGYQPYGAWIFWRFLSEWSGPGRASDPSVVRQVWEAAVGKRYSAGALRTVLQDRHTSAPRAFAAFGTWIRDPGRYFSEGRAYRAAPLDGWFTLTSTHRSTGTHGTPLDHLSHSFIRFTPGSRLTGRWRLRVSVDMAGPARGSVAQLIVHLRSGHVSVVPVDLGRRGNGTRTVGFRHGSVKRVELDLVNASVRFRCDQGTEQSCQGTSYDDGLRARFRATVVR
ncbi:MAG: hypothetical protein QOF53_1821 [Nocardioidaceae bacterium]|nr:hypothetical protein [Nocardioidaceae bacterium]